MTDFTIEYRHRFLDFNARLYDWAPFLKITRPAVARVYRAHLFGVGYDICWSQNIRFYTAALGHRKWLRIAFGKQMGPIEQPEAPFDPVTLPDSYVQLTLLRLDICFSRRQGWRGFFRDRRVF